jgi:ubiquinone/menaquinone biosynthesis C-methylase UbiE
MSVPQAGDPQYLSSQYHDAAKLNARIGLHQRFSTNGYGWQRWVFDQLEAPPEGRVLELGCGPGTLWVENRVRIPVGWGVTLSDMSAGMVEEAQRNLGNGGGFRYEVVDAQAIPLADGAFDAVIANHMLYHVPDRPKALAEVRRVLRPGGRLYATTNGTRNLAEIDELLRRFDGGLEYWGKVTEAFNLENGAAQLAPWFGEVTVRRYEDALVVTEVEPLLDYILSGWAELLEGRRAAFGEFLAREMAAGGGAIRIGKDAGMFVGARNS